MRGTRIFNETYLPMTLLAFMVMIVVANHSAGDDIADFNGLANRSPFLAFAMLVAMASLAGVPFTAGFLGKLLVFAVAIAHRQYLLCIIGVVTVGCGFYYYLRVVRAMYFQSAGTGKEPTAMIPVSLVTRVTIIGLIAAIFVLGVYPLPVLGGGLSRTEGTKAAASNNAGRPRSGERTAATSAAGVCE